MKIINWLKRKLGILTIESENNYLKNQLQQHKLFVDNKMAELKQYTRVDADVGFRGITQLS